MEQYRNIFDRALRDFGQSGTARPEDLFPVISDEVLIIDLEGRRLMNNHSTFPYSDLKFLLKRLSARYIIVTNTCFPVSGKLLSVPSHLARSGWGHSLWQAYSELYYNSEPDLHCPGLLGKLQIMESILELCNLREIRKAYENKDIINIFGWLYDSTQKKIEDINTDLLLTLDETLFYRDSVECITS